jgi:hypothetical protein
MSCIVNLQRLYDEAETVPTYDGISNVKTITIYPRRLKIDADDLGENFQSVPFPVSVNEAEQPKQTKRSNKPQPIWSRLVESSTFERFVIDINLFTLCVPEKCL